MSKITTIVRASNDYSEACYCTRLCELFQKETYNQKDSTIILQFASVAVV